MINQTIQAIEDICTDCPEYGTSQCDRDQCSIGFSLERMEDYKANGKLFTGLEVTAIPYEDYRYYDEKKIAGAIASICKLCKECREYHKEECVVSLARKSLEDTVLKDMENYPGNFLSYVIQVSKQDAHLSELIMEAFQGLSNK